MYRSKPGISYYGRPDWREYSIDAEVKLLNYPRSRRISIVFPLMDAILHGRRPHIVTSVEHKSCQLLLSSIRIYLTQ